MTNNHQQQAKVITPEELKNLRYPLPESWRKAAGILRGRNIHPLRYQRHVRRAWEERLEKLDKLARNISRPK
jgi:hypothetical protein